MTRAGHLAQNVRALRLRVGQKAERALRAASGILLEASNELCPKETTALVNSGGVRQKGNGLQVEFIVGYARTDFDPTPYGKDRIRRPPHMYSMYVHVMQVPFLSIAAVQSRDQMRQKIREVMKK